MIWLTADLHIDHENIIQYCQRPFESISEMNVTLLNNIYNTVAGNDTLYVLGDFCFGPRMFECYAEWIKAAVPNTIFLKGNHDPKQRHDPLALDFKHNKHHFYLCHYPWATWRPNTVMLHGHSHGNPIPLPEDSRQKNRFDVGVDTEWGGRKYFPVSVEQILERIE